MSSPAGSHPRCAALLAALLATLLAPLADSACAAPANARRPLALGPVVQNVDRTSASLLWATDGDCLAEARVRPVGTKLPELSLREKGSARMLHRARFVGLKPSVRYQYHVSDCRGRWHSGSFGTAGDAKEPFTFLVYGDCRSRPDLHKAVVEAMLEEQAAFAVNTGDLVADGTKTRLWYQFFKVERPLLRQLPMYPVLGNHELYSSWTRGLAAFRRYFSVPQNGPNRGVTYSFVHGNSLFLVLDSNSSFVGTAQTSWARTQLEAAASSSAIAHIFVFLHHSPYASGIHGENEDAQIAGLPRLFTKYGVDAVFAGHDHVYERGEADGLRYIISGGCGAPLYPRRRINAYTAWFESTTHFVRVAVHGQEVEYTALRPGGSIIDSFKYIKRKGAAGEPDRFVTLTDSHPLPVRPAPRAWRRGANAATGSGLSWIRLSVAALLALLGLLALLVGRRLQKRRTSSGGSP